MTKSYKEIKKEKEGSTVQIQDACWVGYKQVGMKKKGNRQVPNCVKEEVVNALFGKDYIYESVADMYKGTVTKDQLAKMKKLWSTKKASDVTPSVKNFVKGLDQFTQMDIKKANIKYISDLIEAAWAVAGGLGGPAGVGAAVGVETVGIGLGAFGEIADKGGVAGLTCFGALADFSASSATDFS